MFTLIVDDFGIKFLLENDLDHLIGVLRKYYNVKVDMTGQEYWKIELDWDYDNRQVHLSMERYLKKALAQFGIQSQKSCKICCIHTFHQSTEQKNNSLSTILLRQQQKMNKHICKKSQEKSTGMDVRLTQRCSLL